jgi:hypothetical protein
VSRLFSRAELHEEVAGLARLLTERNAFALGMHKANLVSAEKLNLQTYIDIESARHLTRPTALRRGPRPPADPAPKRMEND